MAGNSSLSLSHGFRVKLKHHDMIESLTKIYHDCRQGRNEAFSNGQLKTATGDKSGRKKAAVSDPALKGFKIMPMEQGSLWLAGNSCVV